MNTLTLPNGKSITIEDALPILRKYYEPTLQLYDLTSPGPHDELTPLDLLSLNALNAYIGLKSPMAVMGRMWEHRDKVTPAVRAITKSDLQELDQVQLHAEIPKLVEAIKTMRISDWGDTRRSKLLHRLRPNIMPIWDETLTRWGYDAKSEWDPWLRLVFSQVGSPQNRDTLRKLQELFDSRLSVLRLWDIVLWKAPGSLASQEQHRRSDN